VCQRNKLTFSRLGEHHRQQVFVRCWCYAVKATMRHSSLC